MGFNYREYMKDNWLLKESQEVDFSDPESVLDSYSRDKGYWQIWKGEGFDPNQIVEALKQAFEDQVGNATGAINKLYGWWDFDISPDKMGVGTLQVNPQGAYEWNGITHKCRTFEEGAEEIKRVLTTQCSPKEIQSHVKGWIIGNNHHFRNGIYPLLDPEGVKIYLGAEDKLSSDVQNSYKGSNYWGD